MSHHADTPGGHAREWTWAYYGRCGAEIFAPDGSSVAVVGLQADKLARATDTDWYRSTTPAWVQELDESVIPKRQRLAAEHAATIVSALNRTHPTRANLELFGGLNGD